MEGLSEGGPAQDGYGGPVAHQTTDTYDDREDSLADGAPDLRLPWHRHTHLWNKGMHVIDS